MPKAYFQILRATAAIVAIVVCIFGVLPFGIDIWRGAAPLDAAVKPLIIASIFGGIIGLFVMGVLSVYRFCPECRKVSMIEKGRTRTEFHGRMDFYETECERCGYMKWTETEKG